MALARFALLLMVIVKVTAGRCIEAGEGDACFEQNAGDISVLLQGRVKAKTHEEPTTTLTPTGAFDFAQGDCSWFRNWSLGNTSCERLPRVLIYTWATEDQLTRYNNEAFWKSCYAHAHGFDLEFTEVRNISGLKQWNGPSGSNGSSNLGWYSDANMWPWLPVLKNHLSSGHDLTVMDQGSYAGGLNENALLFRSSNWSLNFLDTMYAHRKNFNIQGDNGPFMETILTYVDRDHEPVGYNGTCADALVLDKPAGFLMSTPEGLAEYAKRNEVYSNCFFKELDRLAGPFGSRRSKHIGFSHISKEGHLPWANCWSFMRDYAPTSYGLDPKENCFAYHWNGAKAPGTRSYVTGECPDASFNWKAAPYNIENPHRPKYN